MEYVNINSLRRSGATPSETKELLLQQFDALIPEDYIIATDELEIIRGTDVVESASSRGQSIIPLRRVTKSKQKKDFPKRVLLELTSECNGHCTMCPRKVLTRKEQHMDASVAKEIIKQLDENGIDGLWLFNIGESLLHPDFFGILDYCRTFDTLGTIWLSTNCEILDEDMIEKVINHPVDILNYSINSMSEEEYSKLCPNLHFDRVRHNLEKLVERKKELNKSRPIIRAQMIEIPHVLHEIDMFKEIYGDKVDIISINKLEVFAQEVNTDSLESIILNDKITKCNRLEGEVFYVFSDGSVSCCATDFNNVFNIGNVHDQSIKEIYQGEKYQSLIKLYREGRLHERELCSRCRDFEL